MSPFFFWMWQSWSTSCSHLTAGQDSFSPMDEPISYWYRIPVVKMETKSFSIDIIPDIATSASSAETYQRGVRSSVWSMDSLSPRMSWRNEAGSDLVIQMMRRSWRATCVKGYASVQWLLPRGLPCTLLLTTRALAATSRIGVSPSRTIFPSTLPREIIDRMKEDLRIASRKILNGIGFTVVEGLLSNQGMWPYVE